MQPSPRPAELVLVVALIAGGAWLRWCHLETPSLWWDEIVHVRIAEQPTLAAVWRKARDGGQPGSGNAGAVPLDYLLLHTWLRLAPVPSPATIERHHRLPAFAFAVAALPLAWALGRTLGGPAAGTLAIALLATSIPAVLYAAEARFYSLYVLATLANLASFAAVVRAPAIGRLALFMLIGIAYVASGLYGVFPLAAEYVVLGLLALVRWRDWRLLAGMIASGFAIAMAMALWVPAMAIRWSYGRGTPSIDVESAFESLLLFFAAHSVALAAIFGAAFLVAPLVARRDRVAGALAAVFVLSTGAVPVMVAIAHAKQYYFHPRHALFLLPMVLLATAFVGGRALARLVRAPTGAALAGALLGVAASAATVRAYVTEPLAYFRATKTLRDVRGLVHTIATHTAGAPASARYLLLAEKRRPGHLANPTLAFYLERHGLADRVMLAGVDDPFEAARKLPALCPHGCRGPARIDLHMALGVTDAFDQSIRMRQLLRLGGSPWSDELSGVGIVAWAPPPAGERMDGVRVIRLDGATLFEPAPRP